MEIGLDLVLEEPTKKTEKGEGDRNGLPAQASDACHKDKGMEMRGGKGRR